MTNAVLSANLSAVNPGSRATLFRNAVRTFAFVGVFSAFADVATFLGPDDAQNTSALNKAASWSNNIAPTDAAASSWDYVVSKTGLRSPVIGRSQYCELKCHSFSVGVLDGDSGVFRDCNLDTGSLKFDNEGLVLANGTWYRENSREVENAIYGNVCVTAPKSKPFVFYGNTTTGCGNYQFYGPWSSEPGTCIRFESHCDLTHHFRVKFFESCPSFNGDLIVAKPGKATYSSMQVLFGNVSFAGNVIVQDKAVIGTLNDGDVVSLGSLELDEGAEIRLGKGGRLNVKNALIVNGRAKMVVAGFSDSDLAAGKVVFVSLDENCSGTLDSADFDLDISSVPLAGMLKDVVFGVSQDGRSLELAFTPLVQLLERNSDDNAALPDKSAVTNGTAWTDGLPVHAGADYVVGSVSTACVLRTVFTDTDSFLGRSLSILSGATLAEVTRNWTCPNLILHSGSLVKQVYSQGVHNWYGDTLKVVSDPQAADDTVTVLNYFNNQLYIRPELIGDGNLVFQAKGASSWPKGYFYLTNLNTNFTGTVKVTMISGSSAQSGAAPSLQNFAQLEVTDKRNLGGPLPAFNPKSLVLEQMSVLRSPNDISLDESTRGIYIGNMGRIDVPSGKTFAITSPLAVHGEFRKDGSGVLALGGTLSFGESGLDAEPTDGLNVLTIAGGAVKPLSATCCNGLEISLAEGTALRYAVEPAAADLAQSGIVNVKTDTPFLLGAGGLINVQFEFPDPMPKGGQWNVGLVTVKKTVAGGLRGNFRFATLPRGYMIQLVEHVNDEDGTVTFAASIARKGIIMVVR